MRLIKRYSNRKLYDTFAKSYITFENIESIIKQGEEIQIIDNDSGDDITAVILSQVIAEHTRKHRAYSPYIFVEMIRKGSGTMYDYARRMLQVVGETASSVEEEIENKIKNLVTSGKLTEEEGKELKQEMAIQHNAYLQKVEQQLEGISQFILEKLSIPTKADVKHLQDSLARLEKCVYSLEHSLQNKNSQQKPQDENQS